MSFELSMQQQDVTANERAEKLVAAAEDNTDKQLIAFVLANDETAFAALFERYKRLVARFAARYFASRETIEEIVQITFANAYFALETFNGAHEKSFSAWLLRIANNACLDQLRRNTRRREDSLSELTNAENEFLSANLQDSRGATVEQTVVFKDLAGKLLARLPPEDQMLLRLLDAAEMSVAEVSDLTGWSVSNVKIRAHRARKSLRKILHKLL